MDTRVQERRGRSIVGWIREQNLLHLIVQDHRNQRGMGVKLTRRKRGKKKNWMDTMLQKVHNQVGLPIADTKWYKRETYIET